MLEIRGSQMVSGGDAASIQWRQVTWLKGWQLINVPVLDLSRATRLFTDRRVFIQNIGFLRQDQF